MKLTTQFDHQIRGTWVTVDAYGLYDHEGGPYKTDITGVYLDGVDVIGLLTDADILEIESRIDSCIFEDEIEAQGQFDPARDAFRLGE